VGDRAESSTLRSAKSISLAHSTPALGAPSNTSSRRASVDSSDIPNVPPLPARRCASSRAPLQVIGSAPDALCTAAVNASSKPGKVETNDRRTSSIRMDASLSFGDCNGNWTYQGNGRVAPRIRQPLLPGPCNGGLNRASDRAGKRLEFQCKLSRSRFLAHNPSAPNACSRPVRRMCYRRPATNAQLTWPRLFDWN